jgi:hypothetical protein
VCGCTLITDVDREAIPRPAAPSFPEIDAGATDASVAPPAVDAGVDASADAGLDSGPEPDAAAPDAAAADAAADADAG